MRRGPQLRALRSASLVLAIVLSCASRPASAQIRAEEVSSAFALGPYTSLYVDPSNAARVAIGTANGLVSWSEDAGRTARDARAISPRRYDGLPMRGGGQRRGLAFGPSPANRATRLFIRTLQSGGRVARFAHWMTLGDPVPEVSSIALAGAGGRNIVASPYGVHVSDTGGEGFTRTLGGPGQMPREGDLVVFSVSIDPTRPTHVFAGTSQGVMISTDGGFTFRPHPSASVREEQVLRYLWDGRDPNVLLALTWNAVLQSFDAGETFQVVYAAEGEVRGVVLLDEGGYIATADGLVVVEPGGGQDTVLRGRSIVGVALQNAGLVVATDTELFIVDENGQAEPLANTTPGEPYLALQGSGEFVWAMTAHTIYRVGTPRPLVRARQAPRVRRTVGQVVEAVNERMGFGGPSSTRLHNRWYAKLLPTVVVEMSGGRNQTSETMRDGTLPVRVRRTSANDEADLGFSVFALWDLTDIVFGDNNVSNPDLLLERNLRDGRAAILQEVRRRYRDAASLARRLERPPRDPLEQFSLRLRLSEHAAYLEAMSGVEVVSGEDP